MLTKTQSHHRSGYGSNVLGKSVLISFPAHETHLIDELDQLAHLDFTTRSEYVRRLIRKDRQRTKDQSNSWSSIIGEK